MQVCLLSDIVEDSTMTREQEEGNACNATGRGHKAGATRGSEVPSAGAYCKAGSSEKKGVDDEVADHPRVSQIGGEEHSEGWAV